MSSKVVDDAEQQSIEPHSDEHTSTMQQERREVTEKVRQYESGEKGKLNTIFPGSLHHWLDHCCTLGEQLYCIALSLVLIYNICCKRAW